MNELDEQGWEKYNPIVVLLELNPAVDDAVASDASATARDNGANSVPDTSRAMGTNASVAELLLVADAGSSSPGQNGGQTRAAPRYGYAVAFESSRRPDPRAVALEPPGVDTASAA